MIHLTIKKPFDRINITFQDRDVKAWRSYQTECKKIDNMYDLWDFGDKMKVCRNGINPEFGDYKYSWSHIDSLKYNFIEMYVCIDTKTSLYSSDAIQGFMFEYYDDMYK